MPRAYSYIRFSRPEQLRGDSLRRQREKAEEWAVSKGLVIDESITDLGVSGFRGANRINGALGRFLDLVNRGRVEPGSVLIVESLDRISREAVRLVTPSFLSLINAGVRVVTLIDGQEYSAERLDKEPMAIFGAVMVMIRANEESSVKSVRVGDAWETKRKSGDVLSARIPAWLKVETVDGKRTIVEIPARVRVVRLIFNLTIAGYGRRQIVLRLKGEETFGGADKWQPSYVAKVLANRAVMGEHQPCKRNAEGKRVAAGPVRPDYFPAIVDEVTFLRANAAKAARATTRGKRGEGVSNILQGLAKCGVCKRRMLRENKGAGPKGGRPYLVCAGYRDGECANERRWTVDDVERRVLQGAIRVDLAKALSAHDAPPAGPTADDLALKRAELERGREILLPFVLKGDELSTRKFEEMGEEAKTLDVEIVRMRAEERRLRGSGTAEERRLRITEIMERLDAADGEDRTALRTRLAQELRASLAEVRFFGKEVGVVYKEGRISKGAVLRQPTYLPIFRDHDDWKEQLAESETREIDPADAARDRAWLAGLGKRRDVGR